MVGLSEIYSKKLQQTVDKLADLKKCSVPEPVSTVKLTAPQSDNIRKELKQQQRYLTELEIETAIIEYRQGRSTYELAMKFGCHRNTITEALKKNGVEISHSAAAKPLLVKRVIELYAKGMNAKEVGKTVGLDCGTVRQVLKDNGVYRHESVRHGPL